MDKKTTYLVTSIESQPFYTDDPEEAIVIFSERKNEKGARISIYKPDINTWLILGEALDAEKGTNNN